MFVALYSLAEWALLFAVFFLRNVYQYLRTPDQDSDMATPLRYLQNFFVYHASTFPNLFPCYALLFDEKFMNQLLLLVFAGISIRNQAAGSDDKITQLLVQHEIHSDLANTLSGQLFEARNIAQSIPHGEEFSAQ